MPVESMKITIPAITDSDYDLLCGRLRQLRVKSLRSWAIQRKLAVSTTYAAARGRRDGAMSRKIQKQLRETIYAEAK